MGQSQMEQHVVVMRHGERRDNVEPLWAARASRRWDPPLTDDGKAYAFKEGRHFLGRYNFSINRVIVSPFLRCLQTANEVVSALRAVDYDPTAMLSSSDVTIDPSKIKVLFCTNFVGFSEKSMWMFICEYHYHSFLQICLFVENIRKRACIFP